MDVCVLWVLCVFAGPGLCNGPITRPGESYQMCVITRLQWLGRKRLDWGRKKETGNGADCSLRVICLVSVVVHPAWSASLRASLDFRMLIMNRQSLLKRTILFGVYFVFVITSRSAADLSLGLRVRIQPGVWMAIVSVVCCQVDVCSTGLSLV